MSLQKKAPLKEQVYFVKGMHCASCEVLIEKALIKKENIEGAEASTSQGKVTILYQGKKPSLDQFNRQFKEHGYLFSEKPVLEKNLPLFRFQKGGLLIINQAKLKESLKNFSLALIFIFLFLFLSRTGLASRISVNQNSALPAFLLFGLLAGFSSCAALVGGLVLSMTKQWGELYRPQDSAWLHFQPHLLFNLGRLVSFTFFGGLLGILGSWLQVSLTTTAFLTILVSVLMVFLAFQMLGVKAFRRFQITVPKFISRFVADETNFKGRYMPALLGAMTFFLPCGFTITAQGLALASGSSFQAALIMFFFALGTLPMLLTIGFSSLKFTQRPHLTKQFLKVAGFLVLFFGLYHFNSQLNVLGLPSLDDLGVSSAQISQNGLAPLVGGRQQIKMEALAYAYEPNYFKVKAGLPVRWEITNGGVSGCTNAIVSKGLFEGEVDLNNQKKVVKEFTPSRPGRYKFSCWMGMVSGVIEVVDQATGNNSGLEEVPAGASGCSGGNEEDCTGGCGGGCGNPGCPYAN